MVIFGGVLCRLITLINLLIVQVYAAAIAGNSSTNIVGLQSDGHASSTSFLGEEVPDDFETSVTFKVGGKILSRPEYLLDSVLFVSHLALAQGWDSRIASKVVNGIESYVTLSAVTKHGVPGWQVKSAMWALVQTLQRMEQDRQYQELNFWSKMNKNSPVIGFGKLTKFTEASDSVTDGAGALVNYTDSKGSVAGPVIDSSEDQDTVFSRKRLTKRVTPNVYISDLYKTSNVKLSEYGIFLSMMSLVLQQAYKADQQGLDTVISEVIGVYNRDFDLSIAMGPTSPKSQTLTIRKAILAVSNLASSMAGVTPPRNKYRPVDFKIREDGAFIGNGVICQGQPPMQPGMRMLLLGGGLQESLSTTNVTQTVGLASSK